MPFLRRKVVSRMYWSDLIRPRKQWRGFYFKKSEPFSSMHDRAVAVLWLESEPLFRKQATAAPDYLRGPARKLPARTEKRSRAFLLP
jgi:hypothetical protein